MKIYYVYILKCSDGSYYTGVTNNLERRLAEHEIGLDPKSFTFRRRPLELVYYADFQDPKQAITFEKQLKKWTRKKKEALINDNIEILKQLAACKNKTSYKIYYASLLNASKNKDNEEK